MNDCVVLLPQLVTYHAQVILHCCVVGFGLYRIIQEIVSKSVGPFEVISPCKSVGSRRRIWHAVPSCLCQGQRHIDVAAVLQHPISKVVGRDGLFRLDLQGLFVISLGLTKISTGFLESPKDRKGGCVVGMRTYPLFPGTDGLCHSVRTAPVSG